MPPKKKAGPVSDDPDPAPYLFISADIKREDSTKPFDAKTACWVPCEKECYVQGKIADTQGDFVTVNVGYEEKKFKKAQVDQVNPPKYEKCEDMSNLTYLNDASVLHNLKQRYYIKLIYTYSGLFCVAINPYKRFPIYTNRAIAIYKGRRRNEVPPHIFAISDGAYMDMLANLDNQSMLITGESGAGKTENTKKVIAYFANVGASKKKKDDGKGSLEDQVVQTNPVLEAFGNAKTTRNDNSSRFGKFIRIHFGNSGKLAGADIETYLLEKARVISQQPLERSYHIFYQIMSGAVEGLTEKLFLGNDIYKFNFVSQGKTTIPSMDDNEEFALTHEAFDILNFSPEEKENIYKITAAVMHTGTMKFKQKGREEQAEADGAEEGANMGKLLGIEGLHLYLNLCKPRIKVGSEFVTQGRSKNQVYYSLGALAKAMFDRLFKWLVIKCNMTLDTKQKRVTFIGVLDIAGFEIFEHNGFEQLCINFTNEKLQQFFNHHMFVLEQEEYKREGIDWVFVDFGMDLQACIELMEKKMGVLAILEEESMFPKATDKSFEDKLNSNHMGKSPCFLKPKPPNNANAHFAIAHYAGTVPYNLCGWLEKNKDPLNDTVVDQFKKGTNKLLIEIFADHPGQSAPADSGGGGKGGRKKGGGFATVSSAYREQLNGLMKTLNSTSPHFIRCIIPNEFKQPGVIDSHLVMHQLTCNGVLEGIRICRKGFPNRMVYPDFKYRYKILAAAEMTACKADKDAAAICFEKIKLDPDLFRLGNTKVFFRAGVLGQMEEIRDDRLSRIFAWMQAWIRGYFSRIEFKTLCEQREGLFVAQRAIRGYMQLKNWAWFRLWVKVRPMLYETRIEDEIKAMEEEANRLTEMAEKEQARRQQLEEMNTKIAEEKLELYTQLESSQGNLTEFYAKQERIQAQKADLERELGETQERLASEEQARADLMKDKRQLEHEVNGTKRDIEDIEVVIQKAEQDKAAKDHQIRNLNDEIALQDENINKFNRDKKQLQERQMRVSEDLQSQEEKVSHMLKVKQKLEATLEELDDSLEREKRLRADIEKERRRVEGDLKLTQEVISDLERSRKELEQSISRKEKDITAINGKLEDEQGSVIKLQKNVKELQSRVEQLEEELEAERQARAKSEKQRSNLARELEELGERLDEAGGATAAQIELNKKRDSELNKLRRDLEEQNILHESATVMLRRKQQEALSEVSEQVDQLNKTKSKLEKERSQLANEAHDARQAVELVNREKQASDKNNKILQQQINEVTAKLDEVHRTINDFDMAKKRLSLENGDLMHQLEEAEVQVSQMTKLKSSLTGQLDETRRTADDEARERSTILGKYRNLEHHLDSMRQQLAEETEHKIDLQRQVTKANSDSQLWRQKFEQDGAGRAEELEDIRRKMVARLQESEEHLEALNAKNMHLEKTRSHLNGQIDDMHVEVDRAQQLANAMEKKARNFDKVIGEWKMKVDDLSSELDSTQKDCRNYSTELFRVKAAADESQDHLDSVRRENKQLTDEIKDLMDQITEGGRNVHDIDKRKRLLEVEKEELQSALEEAEAALEQEESKVLREQLEMSHVRQEIEQRIHEKEEEFVNTRKTYQRQLDSLQSSLETEAKGRAEALRLKKKLEADVGELEIALDHSNKASADALKSVKRHQNELRELQGRTDEEQRSRGEVREQLNISERRGNALNGELDESRMLLEQADRGRRQADTELVNTSDHLAETQNNLAAVSAANRKLDSEVDSLHTDLDEMLNEARNSEEKAKKAMVDAARLADELRAEQENAQHEEKSRKMLETHVKEMQNRVDESEQMAIKNGRKIVQKLEDRLRSMETELDSEQRRHSESQGNLRKTERRIKELSFQADEDRKNHERMQDVVDKLQQKIKTYKRQIEEAEEIAALNLAKFRKAQQEMEESGERSELAEQTLSKFRARGRGASAVRGASPTCYYE